MHACLREKSSMYKRPKVGSLFHPFRLFQLSGSGSCMQASLSLDNFMSAMYGAAGECNIEGIGIGGTRELSTKGKYMILPGSPIEIFDGSSFAFLGGDWRGEMEGRRRDLKHVMLSFPEIGDWRVEETLGFGCCTYIQWGIEVVKKVLKSRKTIAT